MKLSIGGYSFFNTIKEGKMDVFGYLETVKYRYHLDTVDLWNGQFCESRSSNSSNWTLPDESVLKKIRQAMDEKGLTLINIAIDGAHIWDPDPDQREELYQNAVAHLRAAVLLGAKTVRIDTGGRGLNTFTDEQLEHVVKRYREYCQHAADNGYRIGPENHMGPSLIPTEVKRLAEAVDHPNFGFLLHLNRWQEDQEIGDEIVAPWVYHTHFDARTAVLPNAVDKINMLKKSGFDGYWGVEYNAEKHQYTEMEWLLASVKRLLHQSNPQ